MILDQVAQLEARRREVTQRIELLRAGEWWHVGSAEEAELRMLAELKNLEFELLCLKAGRTPEKFLQEAKVTKLVVLEVEWADVTQKLDRIRAGEYWFTGDPAEVEGRLLFRLDEIDYEIGVLQKDLAWGANLSR